MITYFVLLLFLALQQGFQANVEDYISQDDTEDFIDSEDTDEDYDVESEDNDGYMDFQDNNESLAISQETHPTIKKLLSQLNKTLINNTNLPFDLLELMLLQHTLTGYRCKTQINLSMVLKRLDTISSMVNDTVQALDAIGDETADIMSSIDDLIVEIRRQRSPFSNKVIESLTAVTTYLNKSMTELQRRLDAHDKFRYMLLHSCKQIKLARPDLPSGYYTITSSSGQTRPVYCKMESLCGSSDGWTRVAYLNMSDPQQQCPSSFQLYQQGNVRACGRKPLFKGCKTVGSFSSYGIEYREVCGRITGYQYFSPNGFTNIYVSDGVYAEGVGLVHGSPPKHIWTFAAANYASDVNCPCAGQTRSINGIGNNYFCESGTSGRPSSVLYTADPLWDGKNCFIQESPCCTKQFTPPWFHRVLDTPTTNNIDMKTCFNHIDEDSPVGLYEIYIK